MLLAMKLNGGGGGKTVVYISAVFTQGTATIYNTDSLDDLRQYLVVTATYSDSTSEAVIGYTLSGTLTEGTSTITVTYQGKTDTFNVIVSLSMYYSFTDGDISKMDGGYSALTTVTEPPYYNIDIRDNKIDRRRAFYINDGEHPLWVFPLSTPITPIPPSEPYKYPIPIPSNATGVTVSITPNTQYTQVDLVTYDNTNGYEKAIDSGWVAGSNTLSFTAGQYNFIGITSKYNSTGTSYPIEPTELTVTFTTP